MDLRGGNLNEVEQFTQIITLSAPEFIYKLFGVKADKLLSFMYCKKNNHFSHQYFQVLEVDEEIVGGVLAYNKEQYIKGNFKTTLLIIYKLNIGLLYNLLPLIKAQKMVANIDDDEMYISNIAIFPKHRGRGYGSKLLQLTEGRAHKLGCKTLTLDVDADNQKAIRLYKSLGFTLNEADLTTLKINKINYKFYKMSKKL